MSEENKLEKLFRNFPELNPCIKILVNARMFYSRLRILCQEPLVESIEILKRLKIEDGDAVQILSLVKNSNIDDIEAKRTIKTKTKAPNGKLFYKLPKFLILIRK